MDIIPEFIGFNDKGSVTYKMCDVVMSVEEAIDIINRANEEHIAHTSGIYAVIGMLDCTELLEEMQEYGDTFKQARNEAWASILAVHALTQLAASYSKKESSQ